MYKLFTKRTNFLFTLLLISANTVGFSTALADSTNHNSKMPVFECLIQPDKLIHVSSPINGILDKVYVDDSDYVKKGQKLARLESSVQRAAVDVSKAKASRKDEISLKEIDLAFTKRKLTRIIELHNKNSISPSEKDRAETAVAVAEIELQKARNNNELANLEYIKAKKALNKRTIRSPINGVIVTRTASPGESVEASPIFTIAKIDLFKVELIMPVEFFGRIKVGMEAYVFPEIETSMEYVATVSVVDKVIDAPSGTFSVRLSLPNTEQLLPGGLKCQAEFL